MSGSEFLYQKLIWKETCGRMANPVAEVWVKCNAEEVGNGYEMDERWVRVPRGGEFVEMELA